MKSMLDGSFDRVAATRGCRGTVLRRRFGRSRRRSHTSRLSVLRTFTRVGLAPFLRLALSLRERQEQCRFVPQSQYRQGHAMGATRSAGITPTNMVATENGRLMRDLREANPRKPAFVATLSHEIRTPLNNIAGYGEMLADAAFEPYSPQWNDVIGRIQGSVRELLDRVGVALDLAQLKVGELAPASAPPGREVVPLADADGQHRQQ